MALLEKLDIATKGRRNPDWGAILAVSDELNKLPDYRQCGELAAAIEAQLRSRDPSVVWLTLLVLDTCMKNCGYKFHQAVGTKSMMHEMKRLVKKYWGKKRKGFSHAHPIGALSVQMVQLWATSFPPQRMPMFGHAYTRLVEKGIKFPPPSEGNTTPIAAEPNRVKFPSSPPQSSSKRRSSSASPNSLPPHIPSSVSKVLTNTGEALGLLFSLLEDINNPVPEDLIAPIVQNLKENSEAIVSLINSHLGNEVAVMRLLEANDQIETAMKRVNQFHNIVEDDDTDSSDESSEMPTQRTSPDNHGKRDNKESSREKRKSQVTKASSPNSTSSTGSSNSSKSPSNASKESHNSPNNTSKAPKSPKNKQSTQNTSSSSSSIDPFDFRDVLGLSPNTPVTKVETSPKQLPYSTFNFNTTPMNTNSQQTSNFGFPSTTATTNQTPIWDPFNQPNSFSNQPNSFVNQPNSFSNQPNSFSNQPNSFVNQPNSFSNQPNSFSSTNGFQNFSNPNSSSNFSVAGGFATAPNNSPGNFFVNPSVASVQPNPSLQSNGFNNSNIFSNPSINNGQASMTTNQAYLGSQNPSSYSPSVSPVSPTSSDANKQTAKLANTFGKYWTDNANNQQSVTSSTSPSAQTSPTNYIPTNYSSTNTFSADHNSSSFSNPFGSTNTVTAPHSNGWAPHVANNPLQQGSSFSQSSPSLASPSVSSYSQSSQSSNPFL